MRRITAYLIFSMVFLGLQAKHEGQDILVPAGTLLRCTLDEPNFPQPLADIGDPVICHLNNLRNSDRMLFPGKLPRGPSRRTGSRTLRR